ncbi:MAG TPA: TonB-dependent receptor, partial [Vicinamibacterales bacterium]|nr:TonB-dependent receptor [Vicinamibacterales bacterium]
AAEHHGGGMVFVDIMTQPGMGPLRGSMDFTFRDESLNARNPLSPHRGAERQHNGGFSLSGTLWKDRTSFSLTTNASNAYDSKTVRAALPSTTLFENVKRPNDRTNFSARVDHALTKSHTLRGSYQRSDSDSANLGIGDVDLPERGFARITSEDLLRLSLAGPVGRTLYAESRLQVRHQENESTSASDAPAILVLDAFNSGGAQISGGRKSTDVEFALDVDYAKGRHSARAGLLVEGGRYRSDESRNAGGTFTFASLDAFAAGRPTTFTQRSGNPLVEFTHAQAGWYAQDDIRVSKALSLSVGVRQELQTHTRDWWNVAPRVGATWSPFKTGSTTFRASAGIFYDWYEPQAYEQTLRVDGTRQVETVVRNPGYPDPFVGGSVIVLPSGRIVQADDLRQPTTARVNASMERVLGTFGRLNVGYFYSRGRQQLRGRNINAPGENGERPDPTAGIVTQVESTARSEGQMLHAGLNFNLPWHRTMLFVNYTFGGIMNDSDGPFSLPADNANLAAEWGPSPYDVRHRVSGMFNMDLWK